MDGNDEDNANETREPENVNNTDEGQQPELVQPGPSSLTHNNLPAKDEILTKIAQLREAIEQATRAAHDMVVSNVDSGSSSSNNGSPNSMTDDKARQLQLMLVDLKNTEKVLVDLLLEQSKPASVNGAGVDNGVSPDSAVELDSNVEASSDSLNTVIESGQLILPDFRNSVSAPRINNRTDLAGSSARSSDSCVFSRNSNTRDLCSGQKENNLLQAKSDTTSKLNSNNTVSNVSEQNLRDSQEQQRLANILMNVQDLQNSLTPNSTVSVRVKYGKPATKVVKKERGRSPTWQERKNKDYDSDLEFSSSSSDEKDYNSASARSLRRKFENESPTSDPVLVPTKLARSPEAIRVMDELQRGKGRLAGLSSSLSHGPVASNSTNNYSLQNEVSEFRRPNRMDNQRSLRNNTHLAVDDGNNLHYYDNIEESGQNNGDLNNEIRASSTKNIGRGAGAEELNNNVMMRLRDNLRRPTLSKNSNNAGCLPENKFFKNQRVPGDNGSHVVPLVENDDLDFRFHGVKLPQYRRSSQPMNVEYNDRDRRAGSNAPFQVNDLYDPRHCSSAPHGSCQFDQQLKSMLREINAKLDEKTLSDMHIKNQLRSIVHRLDTLEYALNVDTRQEHLTDLSEPIRLNNVPRTALIDMADRYFGNSDLRRPNQNSNSAVRDERVSELNNRSRLNNARSGSFLDDGDRRLGSVTRHSNLTNNYGSSNSLGNVYENIDNLDYLGLGSETQYHESGYLHPIYNVRQQKRSSSVSTGDQFINSNTNRGQTFGNAGVNLDYLSQPFRGPHHSLTDDFNNVNRHQLHNRVVNASSQSFGLEINNIADNQTNGVCFNNSRGHSPFSTLHNQQSRAPTGDFVGNPGHYPLLLNNLALNNQGPPGTRANNYWDNFRSYSRQNMLSSPKMNGMNNGGHMPHMEPPRLGGAAEEYNNAHVGAFNNAVRSDLVLNRNPVGNGAKTQGSAFVASSKQINKDLKHLPCRLNAINSTELSGGHEMMANNPGPSGSSPNKVRRNASVTTVSSDPGELTEVKKELDDEVNQFLTHNSDRPCYVVELFKKLSLLESDYARHNALSAIHEIVNQSMPLENLDLDHHSSSSTRRTNASGCTNNDVVGSNSTNLHAHHPPTKVACIQRETRSRHLLELDSDPEENSSPIRIETFGLPRTTRDCTGRVGEMLRTIGTELVGAESDQAAIGSSLCVMPQDPSSSTDDEDDGTDLLDLSNHSNKRPDSPEDGDGDIPQNKSNETDHS